MHYDPGERSSDPTRGLTQTFHECPGVSSEGVGQWWLAAGSGALSVQEMANHFSILALRPHEDYEKEKDRILKEELPRSVGAKMLLENSGEVTPERMKRRSQSKNNTQLRM